MCCISLPKANYGLRVLSLPVSVRVGNNQQLLCEITCHPFKLESSHLNQKGKTPWLRFLFWGGWLNLTFKVKLNLKFKIYPILSLSTQGSTFPTALRPGASKATSRATKSYLILARRGKCFSGKLKCCHMSDNRCAACAAIEVQRNDVSQSKLQLYSTHQLFLCAY